MSKPADQISALLSERKYGARTIQSYVHWVIRLESHFSGRNIRTLSPNELSIFFHHLHTQLGAQSVRQAATAIRFLYREIFGKRDLADIVPKIKEDRPKAEIPSQRDILSILAQVDDPEIAIALKCIYGMGLELKEVCKLKVKDFDFSKNRVKVQPQRTRGVRSIPIPVFVLDELKAIAATGSRDRFLFPSKSGGPIDVKRVQRAWNAARGRTSIQNNYDIRSLRHAYILDLERLGVPLKDVLHNIGMHKARALDFYSSYAGPAVELTFSPADRVLAESISTKQTNASPYISELRIIQLAEIKHPEFDFTRLIAMLHELNSARRNNNYLSIAFLVRAVIDHIPPVFGFKTFIEVTNNYKSSVSLKKQMENLQKSLRNVADAYLHEAIRSREDLPHYAQVDFSAALDHVLGEVVRVLKKRKSI